VTEPATRRDAPETSTAVGTQPASMALSRRILVGVVGVLAVIAITVAAVVFAADDLAAYVGGASPFALAAVVGLLGVVIGAAVANALTGPGGPRGPDGPTAADRRPEANEWNDPPGVDVEDDDED